MKKGKLQKEINYFMECPYCYGYNFISLILMVKTKQKCAKCGRFFLLPELKQTKFKNIVEK